MRVYTKRSEWDRFNEKWIPHPKRGCWIWTAAINGRGYGVFSLVDRRARIASRVAWRLYNGSVPDGLEVMHKCDHRACVNPDHLSLGTHAENMEDMTIKRRQSYGESRWSAKLTEQKVVEIRESAQSAKVLSKKYGVSKPTIYLIRSKKIWKEAN